MSTTTTNGDATLVGSLVERLTTRLPHRTGTNGQDLHQDDVVLITRATLVKISATSIHVVLDALLSLIEDLARPYKTIASHPPHVLFSELYTLALIADCCSSHWNAVGAAGLRIAPEELLSWHRARFLPPEPLDDTLIIRIFEILKLYFKPLPEGYVLPAKTILDDTSMQHLSPQPQELPPGSPMSTGPESPLESTRLLEAHAAEIEVQIKTIVEYATASSWPSAFDYFRNVIYGIRATGSVQSAPTPTAVEDERAALIILRLVACFWVDSQKLGLVIQEFCSSYLHFRKQFQNAVAIVTPLLITRWLDRYPEEFVQLHTSQRRLDGGADTLFDMSQTVGDNARRKTMLYPLQIALLFLLPDVFEVASNMREAKSGGLVKKVGFLDSLRKALRNRNDQAAYCLVSLLRAARHFSAESDAALVSYALDVQDEVRDAVFRRSAGIDGASFDQDIMTAAFVSLAHLNFEGCVETLAPGCLAPTSPPPFKVAVIQACSHFARLDNHEQYQPLFTAASAFIQGQLKTVATIFSDVYFGDQASQRRVAESGSVINKTCSILTFLDASPMTLFEGPPQDRDERDRFFEDNFESFVSCMIAGNETIRQLAVPVAKRLLADDKLLKSLRASERITSQEFKSHFWKLSSLVLMSMCDKLEYQQFHVGLTSIHAYLESRLLLLTSIPETSELSEEIPERTATSTKLEMLFLVSLCSADINTCQLVTSCINLFLEECRVIDTASESAKSSSTLLRNGDVFREIASRGFRFTGLVAFQKRIRSLLRRMQYPSAGILNAWEIAFEKWLHLSKDVSTISPDTVSERTVIEWRNASGFLASLGGICTADQAANLEEPTISGLKWIDRVSSENHEEPLLHRFLRLSIQLLACGNVRVRETMREVLSSEISSSLYQPMFKALESELDVLFAGALEPTVKGHDSEIIFAEQAASLLRALVERLDSPSELGGAASFNLGTLTLNFAKFLDGISDSPSSLRVKIKVCQLCEATIKRKEHLNLRDDLRIRNQLLEYIFGWIARPRSPRTDGSYSTTRQDELQRVQRDLDKACLRCLAELTYRLPLQPSEGQTDAGTSELKSQMFHTYFNRFLSLLNLESSDARSDAFSIPSSKDDGASSSDLAITILSNLLSANIDVGLKHSLSIGYHENVEIRTAFVKVLYNILTQGTEFNSLSDMAVSEKYDELLDLLTSDTNLAMALSAVCPSNELDEVTISLLNIFETRGLSFVLLEALIKQEIEDTENESELLRRTSVATKMLSIYAKWKGGPYLKATLQKVLERLMLTSKDLDLELDPARVPSPEELQKNALQLRIVTKVFIDDICTSSANIPPSFRKICSIISEVVMPRFQEAKYTAVGAFIFLRFFCPAIVAPETEGLVSTPPSKEMRRGLLLIAKVIQNLANNVLFGAKEPYMFPLNDFLAQNIYRITTFLREISVPPTETMNTPPTGESFDFGSCVALHRFMYDHWDQVRQRLASQERRDFVRSPAETSMSRVRSPVLEPLRNLITNLGPPPLAVTWNRPQISANSPPAYSRFQDFMLRNAFRSNESFVTARAVYDGGESKDGLSIICVILRNIDAESIDYDTLIYCYLKIASRLWHKPFGLLIDATCYNGHSEHQDDLFQKIEMLTPSELSKQLTRIYVYNMNSTFRKCFRRLLRVSTKIETSVFNPKNVEYHLLGSLQDLQAHFHLSQLHLPKETISVVTDTRYVFQPITRLSKTRGKFEVLIKVGSQFVQVTTTKKQEIYPGYRLSTTVNDIFRLGDVDEAPTSIQTEDDSAFGIRADNGKIVMYFASPKKHDVLQAIRGAKAKYGKDTRALKSFERLIRPQDVPGTLLNLALTNLASPDHVLRLASYNLLGALCRAFKFTAASRLVCTRDIAVPLDPSQFIVGISKKLAQAEPQLTPDFLNEFFVGWESFSEEQKPLSLAYMAPWLPGLRTSLLATEPESDKGREKVAGLFRKLVDVTLSDPSLGFTLEQTVWPAIYQDEVLLDIFLEEIIRTALTMGLHDEHTETLTTIVTSMGTVTLRGKIISRLRKALNRSSLRPTKLLPDNAVWPEICVLLQFCLSLSFDSGVQSQLYLPEIFHIVTMLANTGTPDVRVLVHRLLVNSIHAACTSFHLDETRLAKLKGTLDSLAEPRSDIFSNVSAFAARDGASISTNQDAGPTLAATENLAALLFEICAVAAPSVDMANAWRSRWMSLVASTAFQNNPAIQPRAFSVMGCLAREEVDDDLLYQVLVALRNSIGRFGDDSSNEMLVAIVTSLSKMMAKLPSASRYGLQLFWLAMSLLRLVPPNLFNCAGMFLEAVLTNINTSGDMRGDKMVPYLLQGRVQLEEAALPLDEAYGIHFNSENFHFAACACLVRGLTDTMTKATALRVLSTFLELTLTNSSKSPQELSYSPYMALILARAVTHEELKDSLWPAGINLPGANSLDNLRSAQDLGQIKDKDLLLNTAIELVDFQYLEDAVQNRTLQWLNELAGRRPAVVLHLCGPIISILDDILLHCQNSSTLESAHRLLQTLTSNAKFASALESSNNLMLHEILEDMGFGGLWRSCSSLNGGSGGGTHEQQDRQCFLLTEKLIELIII
ncbi:GTPase-activator protein for ras-like GTPase [Pleurostoma richardsiae]|uniref:GTPase-activator protein for ras-like GTPase n=1 Tax=Pleurostoma richardsiae TaxID=41990 RepID=A0AA38RGD3_9PEZI|nr:GTPase-activator protein for ras-like GTPase [Pleurostoma richardsiae]